MNLPKKPTNGRIVVKCPSVHSFEGTGYVMHNESTRTWVNFMDLIETRISNAAAICSAGEIGLFAILPKVEKRLLLVDHSRYALATAVSKYLLLRSEGIKLYDIVTKGTVREFGEACAKVEKYLPKELRKTSRSSYHGDPLSPEGHPHMFRDMTAYWRILNSKNWYGGIDRGWVKAAVPRLQRVGFLHGDLRDIADQGPYDLLYLSNALEHHNRDRICPNIKLVYDLVKPGG